MGAAGLGVADRRALIGPDGLVNDGLGADCGNNGGTAWTYNQGVILGGLAALYDITGDRATSGTGSSSPTPRWRALTDAGGILTEPCELTADGCNGDGTQFKGIFARYLHDFYQRSGKRAYRAFLLANADSVLGQRAEPGRPVRAPLGRPVRPGRRQQAVVGARRPRRRRRPDPGIGRAHR